MTAHGKNETTIDAVLNAMKRNDKRISDIALQGTASQSSNYNSKSTASCAIDNNACGNYRHCALAKTHFERNPWWKVHLNGVATIKKIIVWNRTDGWSYRLTNTEVRILDIHGNIVDAKTIGEATNIEKFELDFDDVIGSIVMLQRVSDNDEPLQLAEVQVFGFHCE